MPYYMGDYYAGDPGIGSFFKRVVGIGASLIPGVGGILGKIGGAVTQKALPAAAGVATTGIVRRVGGAMATGAGQVGRIISKHPVLSAAGAAGAIGAIAGREGAMMGAPGASMRGYHIERRGKHAGQLIKNRRMRVTNPRALRRALRRAYGFEKLAMRTIHLLHPRKKGRFGGFKRKRRARV